MTSERLLRGPARLLVFVSLMLCGLAAFLNKDLSAGLYSMLLRSALPSESKLTTLSAEQDSRQRVQPILLVKASGCLACVSEIMRFSEQAKATKLPRPLVVLSGTDSAAKAWIQQDTTLGVLYLSLTPTRTAAMVWLAGEPLRLLLVDDQIKVWTSGAYGEFEFWNNVQEHLNSVDRGAVAALNASQPHYRAR